MGIKIERRIRGNELGGKIADALGLQNVRRIILDISLDDLVMVYIEQNGDERLYEVEFKNFQFEIVKK